MNIVHLKYAVEVEKCGSINKAAEALFVGQPNLSRAIKELEASLGITIFERSARGMEITPEGETFLRYAKSILKQIDDVEAMYKSNSHSKLRFSISVPRASYISEAFSCFTSSLNPDIEAELFYKETNALRAIKNILQEDYKLGIIRYADNYDKYYKSMLEEKGLQYEMITEFHYVLAMSKDSALADTYEITFDDLASYTEIAHADPYVPSLPFSAVKKEELKTNSKQRIFVFERASQFDLLSENKNTYMWVSPMPEKLLSRYGLIQKKCRQNQKIYKDVMIYKKDYHLTELDNKFISALCEAKRKYL